jgi:hypothetical protein
MASDGHFSATLLARTCAKLFRDLPPCPSVPEFWREPVPNGVAVLPFVLESPATPAHPSTGAQTEIEITIGEILVEIADVAVRALHEYSNDGHINPTTKMQGGALVAQLHELQATLGENFAATVRQQGRLRLRRRNGEDLSEAAADEITGMIIGVVAQVTALARTWAS